MISFNRIYIGMKVRCGEGIYKVICYEQGGFRLKSLKNKKISFVVWDEKLLEEVSDLELALEKLLED